MNGLRHAVVEVWVSREMHDVASARRWARDHAFRADRMDATDAAWVKFRQRDGVPTRLLPLRRENVVLALDDGARVSRADAVPALVGAGGRADRSLAAIFRDEGMSWLFAGPPADPRSWGVHALDQVSAQRLADEARIAVDYSRWLKSRPWWRGE